MRSNYNDFVDSLQKKNIEFVDLQPADVEAYKQEWFQKFVPLDKQEKALECYCFNRDGYCGYLWHVFSYELLDCLTKDAARKSFDDLQKWQAILLVNIDDIACRIMDVSRLKSDDFEMLDDFIITDINFGWTYVKTHEEMCGPYFYSACTEQP